MALAVIGLLAVGLLIAGCASGPREAQAVMPNLLGKADGVYRGQYKIRPIDVIVDVELTDSRITGITLVKHFHGLGKKAERIIPQVIEGQTLDVEAVSGATTSRAAILKAIETALQD
jgi:uncharacterized protein with FMN-binding domain